MDTPTFKTEYCRFKALFDCLKSDPNSSSKKKLTKETELALVKVDETLNDQLRLILPKDEIKLFLPQNIHLQGVCDKKARWFHLPVTPRKIVLSYPSLVAQLIIKGGKKKCGTF